MNTVLLMCMTTLECFGFSSNFKQLKDGDVQKMDKVLCKPKALQHFHNV